MVTAHVCLKNDFLRICDQYDYELAQLFNPKRHSVNGSCFTFLNFHPEDITPKTHLSRSW